MRVLHIDTGRGWRGGQQQVLWLMEGLRDHGVEQLLLAPEGSPLAHRARQEGIEVAELAPGILSLNNLRRVRALASQWELLHAHDGRAHTLAWAALLAQGRRRARVVVSRRVAFPIGAWSAPKYAMPDAYLAVSEHVRERLVEARVPASKIRVVHDGVRTPNGLPTPSERSALRLQRGVPNDAFLIGTLTSLAPEKMLEQELKLVAQLPSEAHLWLARPARESRGGRAEDRIRESVRRLGLEARFRLLAVEEELTNFLASLDLFLYLSRSEGLGSAILLAMAHAVPVIANRVGGIPEIVRDQETGVLVSGNLSVELPAALRRLMDSPGLRQQLGCAGRQFVLSHATTEHLVARTLAVYQETLEGSLGPVA